MSQIRSTFNVNVFGAIEMTQTFLPLLLASSKSHIALKSTDWNPRIVQMGSLAAICPTPFYSAYNASKAALLQYGNTLRVELEPLGIKVIIVSVAVHVVVGEREKGELMHTWRADRYTLGE